MQVTELEEIFVASGVEMVNNKTFTALFWGYELRGKVIVPSIPTVEFFFYGNVYLESQEQAKTFVDEYDDKFGHAKFRFSDKFISILLDIGSLDAKGVKERLGAVCNFMISNGFGAIGLQPEEPEPEPMAAPMQQPQMQQQRQQQRQPQMQQQRQPQQQRPQQPVYEEPKVPFEQYKALDKLTQIFILGVNKISENMFTTIYHGFNVVGKMLNPTKDDIEIIFYGQLTQNVGEQFTEFAAQLTEKYEKFPVKMEGGSCRAILYFEGKEVAECKEMLGQISGFMMRNNIVAVNLPNTVGRPLKSYTQESYRAMKQGGAPQSSAGAAQSGYNRPSAGYSSGSYGNAAPTNANRNQSQNVQPQGDNNSFAKNFLKKFGK